MIIPNEYTSLFSECFSPSNITSGADHAYVPNACLPDAVAVVVVSVCSVARPKSHNFARLSFDNNTFKLLMSL